MHLLEGLRSLRRILAGLAPLLLVLPAWTSVSDTRINLNRVNRLKTAGRVAPDTGQDLEYRELLRHLPPRGRVGFLFGDPAAPPSAAQAGRRHFFLNYSLAPRLLVASADEPTVIAGDAHARGRLLGDGRFELVADVGGGLSVFRRTK
ncbi:MAG: hypothetical protein WD227_04770 [Vicinamibacterales bacterium]